MSETRSPAIQEFEYRAEMQQLLHLIVHSLYTHREIFLRELLSNAADALNKVRFQQLSDHTLEDEAYKITITLDAEANTISVEDTGIGMTHDDLTARIGTIASSGTLAFLDEMKKADKPVDAHMIGQFGVGFYSSFMVADEVVIETRHAGKDAQGLQWRSSGAGSYTIEPVDRARRGTRVVLHLREDAEDFHKPFRIRQVIRKYSNFIEFPIYLEDEQINTVEALWRKPKDSITDDERSEFYKFITNDFQDPLGHVHLHIEGIVNFDALLFVPSKAPAGLLQGEDQKSVHLYSSGVFIQDDAHALLPDYLRFVRGVVDTDDLPLNVSREVTQKSPVTTKIRATLANKTLGMLKEWAGEDGDRYDTFFAEFGPLFKTGLATEFSRRSEYLDLLRYASTNVEKGNTTSLADYVSRMQDGQESIYYLLADHMDTALRSPNLEYFRSKGIEVLLMVDPVDVFTVMHLQAFDEKPLQSIEQADLDLEAGKEDALSGEAEDGLLALFRIRLGDRIQDVKASRRLVDSAATLVVSSEGMDTQMERMMKMMNQDFEASKKVLEVNTAHPLMKNIWALKEAGERDDLIDQAIEQVYEGALLIDGNLTQTAGFVDRMTDLMVEATSVR